MLRLVKTRSALRIILETAVTEATEELATGACNKLHEKLTPSCGWPRECLDLADLRVAMREILDECLLDIFQRSHRQGPIHTLPPELLALIFSWVETRERAGLGLVCRRWCDTLKGNPHVWEHVNYECDYGNGNVLQRIVGFSGASLLHLDIQIDNSSHESATAALNANMHRCVSLRLDLSTDLSTSAAAAVTAMLSEPAPRIRYFRLFDAKGLFNLRKNSHPVPLFGNRAPQLEVVKIQCRSIALSSSAETLRRVRNLIWSPVANEEIQREDLERVVALCPGLLQLVFDYEEWGDLEDLDLPPLNLPLNLHTLVVASNHADSDPRRVLRTVRADRIPQVVIVHAADTVEDMDDDLLSALYTMPLTCSPTCPGVSPGAFVPRTMNIEQRDPGTADSSLRVSMLPTEQDPFLFAQPEWTMPNAMRQWPVIRRSLWLLSHCSRMSPVCFTHIRRLMIPEMLFDSDFFDSAKNIPELPELERLTVSLMSPNEHIQSVKSLVCGLVSATLSSVPIEEEQRLLRCPQLRTVRLAVDVVLMRDQVARVEPRSITTFIRRHLRYESSQLEAIFLNGIHLYVVDPAELEEMYQLAKEMVYDERHITWKFKRPEVLSWD